MEHSELEHIIRQQSQRIKELERGQQIEAALERIRSRAIGMHNSDELIEVANVMYQELKELGIDQFAQCGFVIVNEEAEKQQFWGSSISGTKLMDYIELPLLGDEVFDERYRVWKDQKAFFNQVLKADRLQAHIDFAMPDEALTDREKESKKDMPETTHFYFGNFSSGYLQVVAGERLPDEFESIFIRFAQVFEQTYTRFLDLQKAEAQAREAQIEAALERVRAASMSMHQSEDLKNVAKILYEQFSNLTGIFGTEICLFDEVNNTIEVVRSNVGTSTYPKSFFIKGKKHPVIKQYWEIWKEKPTNAVITLKGENQRNFLNFLLTETDFRDLPEADKKIMEVPTIHLHFAPMQFGFLLGAGVDEVFQKDDFGIFNRFAMVFEQAYTRFLDLQRAEEQTREAQIELSLEKIRSQVTAMQQSSDLLDIMVMIRQEFVNLGHEAHYFWHMRWLPDQYEKAMTSGDGTRIGMIMTLPRRIHGDIPQLAAWEASDEPAIIFTMNPEAAIDYVHKMIEWGDFELMDPNVPSDDDIRHIGGLTYVMARTTHGEIGYSLPGVVESIPQDNLDTFVRFAGVFDLAYKRFEDLQEKEHQNRETEIDLALERVRSRTMAMQKSDELLEVIKVVAQQMVELGFRNDHVSFAAHNENHDYHFWVSIRGIAEPQQISVPYLDNPMFDAVRPAIQSGSDFYSDVLTPEENRQWLEHFFNNAPNLEVADDIKAKLYQNGFARSIALLPRIMLILGNYEPTPYTEDENQIISRFGRVFDQSYRRFLDLQKAEAQAKEAVKKASLDRVRAEIASMRTADDLEYITPLLWKELTTLEVPFFRCGVFIVNEQLKLVQTFLTTPDGQSLAALDIAFDEIVLIDQVAAHWRKQAIYKDHWDQKEFIAFTQNMIDRGLIKDQNRYQGTDTAPQSLYLHFVPFVQGMLYVGSAESLADDQLGVVQDLAQAFSVAYARYEDFNQLENAKAEVDKALNDLQAAQNQLIHAEKMASLGELTAGIAHEIQNPLNFVNNFSEVSTELIEEIEEELESGNTEEIQDILHDLKQNLQKINHHGGRASGIVKGMLDHSRERSDTKTETNINQLCDEYIRLAYHGLRAKDKSFQSEFVLDLDADLPTVQVVGQDIGRVILNLLNNAFYTVDQKRKNGNHPGHSPLVRISTARLKDKIEIRIADNGEGMPQSVIDKIYQPFFTTKPTGQGTGLGLSLSYDIITQGHGGEMKVESIEGEGTVFIIKLPTT